MFLFHNRPFCTHFPLFILHFTAKTDESDGIPHAPVCPKKSSPGDRIQEFRPNSTLKQTRCLVKIFEGSRPPLQTFERLGTGNPDWSVQYSFHLLCSPARKMQTHTVKKALRSRKSADETFPKRKRDFEQSRSDIFLYLCTQNGIAEPEGFHGHPHSTAPRLHVLPSNPMEQPQQPATSPPHLFIEHPNYTDNT